MSFFKINQIIANQGLSDYHLRWSVRPQISLETEEEVKKEEPGTHTLFLPEVRYAVVTALWWFRSLTCSNRLRTSSPFGSPTSVLEEDVKGRGLGTCL